MVDKRKMGLVDPLTGEMLEGEFVFVGKRISSPCSGKFMLSNQDFLVELAARDDTGFELLRVFIYLNGRLDFNNLIQVSQSEIAETLGMRQPNVSRTMKRLEELGIIIRGPRIGRSSSYRLNPQAGWKGKAKDHRKALRERMDARGLRVVERS